MVTAGAGSGSAPRTRAAGVVAGLAAEIEEEIALGLLHPRERLVEDDLMERFGAKRHAVRTALATLESRGAVERRANVGAFVRSYSAKEVRDLYDVRELLEARCASSIDLPVRTESLTPLVDVQREHDAAIDEQDRRSALRANLRFHEILFGLSGNKTLVEAVRHHARMAATIRSLTVADDDHLLRAQEEHWAMIRALENGDSEGLVQLCVTHLVPSRDAYLRRLTVN
ncbi:GntR family transcriptional regulator [Prauserella cavernicola]|uniref:GntR family transcriptional regulator n=1 Tax=Prauserella cavernicola TaxID=2800127 RepID=A0A934V685_9PSEU|nr:GntR family transcriptional regulator [Prauserella cavernicola]MBK1787272.1 GntR family transcriptional regulator [Prauserella cavernicola]